MTTANSLKFRLIRRRDQKKNNNFFTPSWRTASICYGTWQDLQIIPHLLQMCLKHSMSRPDTDTKIYRNFTKMTPITDIHFNPIRQDFQVYGSECECPFPLVLGRPRVRRQARGVALGPQDARAELFYGWATMHYSLHKAHAYQALHSEKLVWR